jgi:hypothetical protein
VADPVDFLRAEQAKKRDNRQDFRRLADKLQQSLFVLWGSRDQVAKNMHLIKSELGLEINFYPSTFKDRENRNIICSEYEGGFEIFIHEWGKVIYEPLLPFACESEFTDKNLPYLYDSDISARYYEMLSQKMRKQYDSIENTDNYIKKNKIDEIIYGRSVFDYYEEFDTDGDLSRRRLSYYFSYESNECLVPIVVTIESDRVKRKRQYIVFKQQNNLVGMIVASIESAIGDRDLLEFNPSIWFCGAPSEDFLIEKARPKSLWRRLLGSP